MELKPCPFCASTDSLKIMPDYSEDEPERIVSYHVECSTCGCHGRNNYPIGWCESEEEAIEAWNHRGSVRITFLHAANEQEKYIIEKHGPEGQYALYFGRDMSHHGFRLCNMFDFDMNGESTRKAIETALNNNMHMERSSNDQ